MFSSAKYSARIADNLGWYGPNAGREFKIQLGPPTGRTTLAYFRETIENRTCVRGFRLVAGERVSRRNRTDSADFSLARFHQVRGHRGNRSVRLGVLDSIR